MAGLQCPKRLYLEVHHLELAEASDDRTRWLSVGEDVGAVARGLHPDGRLIEHFEDLAQALEETQAALAERRPVFEGAFRHDRVLVRTDILLPHGPGYCLREVKAAASVKEHYLSDCAVQAWVLEGAGIPLSRIELACIDTGFVYPGGGDYRGLFAHCDLTAEARALQPEVAGWVEHFRAVLAGSLPDIPVGDQCDAPYPCPFFEHCSGPATAEETPRGPPQDSPWVGSEPAELLRSLGYPRHYLDFETIQFAVPVWAGTRPYQQLPFQWSCHREDSRGHLTHHEFLDTSGAPPMRRFAEALLETLVRDGPILIYSHFERTVIRQLAELFPDLSDGLLGLVPAWSTSCL
jgi:hypothetical protein